MKIYTKTGDDGKTSLYGGKRVSKSATQIDCYGTLDELNVYVGLLRSQSGLNGQEEILKEIQDRLFSIGSHIASDLQKTKLKKPEILNTDVSLLEKNIDLMDSQLQPLKHFVLPGGSNAVSYSHVARVVCRKAERLMVNLLESEQTSGLIQDVMLKYVNRLSDYFFVLSRFIAKNENVEEYIWLPRI